VNKAQALLMSVFALVAATWKQPTLPGLYAEEEVSRP